MIPQLSFNKVKEYFNGDAVKTWQWLVSPTNKLGGASPMQAIRSGKQSKVIKLIDDAVKLKVRL